MHTLMNYPGGYGEDMGAKAKATSRLSDHSSNDTLKPALEPLNCLALVDAV